MFARTIERIRALVPLAAAMVLALPSVAQPPAAPEVVKPGQDAAVPSASSFRVSFDAALQDTPYSGRVYIVFSTQERGEPRRQMGNWMNPAQMLVRDVTDVGVGKSVDV